MNSIISKLFIVAIIMLPHVVLSNELNSELKTNIESMIAFDKDLDNVLLSIPKNFDDIDHYELIEYKYDKPANKVLIALKDQIGDSHFVKAKFEEAILIPVVNSIIFKGNIIEDSKLIYIKFPKNKETKNLITDSKLLVGSMATKNLLPKRAINMQDIATKEVISKGQLVHISYVTKNLNIETKGIALEGGGIDQYIKVRSVDGGNKILITKVVSKDEVMIEGK